MPSIGSKKKCEFFIMEANLLGMTFENLTILQQYVNKTAHSTFYKMHENDLEDFFYINNHTNFASMRNISKLERILIHFQHLQNKINESPTLMGMALKCQLAAHAFFPN